MMHNLFRSIWRANLAAEERLLRLGDAIRERLSSLRPRDRARGRPSARMLGSRAHRRLYALSVAMNRRFPTNRALLIAGAGIWVVNVLLWETCGLRGCPDVALLASYQPGGATVLLDRDGRRFADLSPFEHALVPLTSLPPFVPQAFVAIEDRRFYRHHGVDWWRVFGAALADLRSGSAAQGSSTITMQLARNLFSDRVRAQDKTLHRKLLEARVAREIEHRYSKGEILQLYLNHIYFGGGAYGVEAASRYYFGKSARSLRLSQAAMLAAIPKAPSHYDPRRHATAAKARRNLVLDRMVEQGFVTAEQAENSKAARLGVTEDPPRSRNQRDIGKYFVEHVRRQLEDQLGDRIYREKLRVYTTLDATLERAAEEELVRQLRAIERGVAGRFYGRAFDGSAGTDSSGSRYLQGAVVAVDARNGDVLALVGGRDFEHSRYDRATLARRQAGSAFKPFVYAAAIDAGIPASQQILDEPVRFDNDGTPWEPQNYDGQFRGPVSVRYALVHSLNVPSVRLAAAVGPARAAQMAHAAGVREELRETPMIALGIAEVSPLELTTAYAAFANLGRKVSNRFVRRVEDAAGNVLWQQAAQPPEPAMDPGVAFITTQLMADAVQNGTGTAVRSAGYYGPAAGKTGTTNDRADAWFVGFTPEIVAGVWIGFDNRRTIASQASGGRAAAPVVGRMLRRFYASRPLPRSWPMPANVHALQIDPSTGLVLAEGCVPDWDAPQTEVFLREATPSTVCPREEFPDFWDRIYDWGRTVFGRRRR